MTVTITIVRPALAEDVFVMRQRGGSTGLVIYPDGNDRDASDFPLCGFSLYYSYQQHIILASEHRERWILSDIRAASMDLELFSPEWRGCCLRLLRA
jgi:hypothetical protein